MPWNIQVLVSDRKTLRSNLALSFISSLVSHQLGQRGIFSFSWLCSGVLETFLVSPLSQLATPAACIWVCEMSNEWTDELMGHFCPAFQAEI